ncbi:2-oxoacid ferredoxin oxidoreductase [Candidatus Woesearchaeota archaeon]|nr:2-oxoacid ferredoxin oxidoreductase [Candidatus Woesearchaeota archaeon]
MTINPQSLNSGVFPNWCPGCGDFAIFASIKQMLVKLETPIENNFFVYGIGCHGHMVNFMKTYGFEGLHGRPIPVAEGAKLVNKSLNVIVVSGDGDTYGEGMSHLMHIMRRNFDITVFVHDNMVYGLTLGQGSPTAQCGFKSRSTPEGLIDHPVNPIALAIAGGATFVARGFAGDPVHLQNLMLEAVKHKGFSIVDIFQPCVTFNHINTYQWFREKVYKLEESGHNPSDKMEALRKAFQQDKLPIGIFYREETEKTYEEQTATQVPLLSEQLKTDIKDILESMR